MRFVCDEMLKRLGHWLRVAGYDVLILPDGSDDRELIERARAERRLLLSSDRRLAEHKHAADRLVLLDCQGLDDCAAALGRQLPIDWLYRPFSRCMLCNTPLRDASPAQRHSVPAAARRQASIVRYCPTCDQLFWNGSHVGRMRERLQRWNRAAEPRSG
jgi:hypothetical protein